MSTRTIQILTCIFVVALSVYSSIFLVLSQNEHVQNATLEIKEKTKSVIQEKRPERVSLPDVSSLERISSFVQNYLPAK